MLHDLRGAFRYVRHRRGLTLLVVVTLGIAIAAATTVFTLADALLWHPLPFPNAERMVRVRGLAGEGSENPLWRLQQDTARTPFIGVYPFGLESGILEINGDARAVTTGFIAPGVLRALGMSPTWGRDFTAAEAVPESRVVLVSGGLWRQLEGSGHNGGPHVTIDGQSYSVIGALPDAFEFPVTRVVLWRPYAPGRTARQITALGWLKPGFTGPQAQAYAATIAPPASNRGSASVQVSPFVRTVPSTQITLEVLLGAAAILLLVAAANVSNLLVADGTRRDVEFAIRRSLGASRLRIGRQILFETLLLSLMAAAAGLTLSLWTMQVVQTAAPYLLTFQALRPIAVDARALVFAGTVAVGAAFAAAALVMLRRKNLDLERVLRTQGSLSPGRNRTRATLIVLQVAVSFVLVSAAALLASSLVRLAAVNPGFDARLVTAITLEVPQHRYTSDAAIRRALESVRAAAAALPGVTNATVVRGIPPDFATRDLRGLETPSMGETTATPVSSAQVDDRFFSTLGIAVVAGRAFTAQDTASAPPVAVISRALAARWWPHDSAIGERFREAPDAPWKTVVGVVGDVRNGSFEQPAGPYAYYTPLAQEKAVWWFEQVVVRSDRPSAELAPQLRALAGRVMPGAPIMETLSGEQAVSNADTRVRFSAILVIVLAVLTLSFALVGMFAGSWQSVEERRRELGVRIALGATPAGLIRMVLGRAARQSIAGLAIGVPAALASTRLVSGLLFGVAPTDARVLGLAAVGLVATALLAASAPARRAATIDPLQSLKSQ